MSHEAAWGELLEDAVRARQLGCFEVEEIAAVAFGDAPPELAGRLLEHAEVCRVCAAELDLARRFEADDVAAGGTVDERAIGLIVAGLSAQRAQAARGRFGTAGARSWLAVAATVLVVSLAGLLFVLQSGETAPVLPGPDQNTIVRSGSVTLLEPAGALTTVPELWRWRAVAGAARYRFELLSVDQTVVFSAEVASGTSGDSSEGVVTLDEDLTAVLRPAVRYDWRVAAIDEAGTEIATSPRVSVRLAVPAAEEHENR